MVEIVNPWALPNLFAGLVGTVVALVVFMQRPGAVQNRAVALFVWLTGLGWALFFGPDVFGHHLHSASFKTAYFAWTLALLSYLWVLSTLDSPLARPLAKRRARIAYTVGLLSLAGLIAGTPLILLRASEIGVDATLLFDVGWMAVVLFGIVVAVSAWKRAPPGLVRRKNAAFALAFIVHDASMFLFLGVTWTLSYLYPWLGLSLGPGIYAIPGVTNLAFQGLLLYGMLSTQLFDIDLKLRWGLSRGTMGAIFVAAFFAASETMAALLTPTMGVVAGILTTALLIVALAPLRRFSDALSGHLVRDATDSPSYRKKRKEMVYEAQVEELMADATISAKERRALLRLQETLGLDAAVAARLEREVLDRLVPVAVLPQQAQA